MGAYSVEPVFRIGRNFVHTPMVVRLQPGAADDQDADAISARSAPAIADRQSGDEDGDAQDQQLQPSNSEVSGADELSEHGGGDAWDESPAAVMYRSVHSLTGATLSSAVKLFW